MKRIEGDVKPISSTINYYIFCKLGFGAHMDQTISFIFIFGDLIIKV